VFLGFTPFANGRALLGLLGRGSAPRSFPVIVLKRDRTQTFSATIRGKINQMKTITVITLLALLAVSGAAISDRILTSEAQTVASVRF
jgi:hypothetical protein